MSSYSEDPILALGATRLWYATPDCLAKHMLPQLNRLLTDKLIDCSGSEEVVACILLLLAMDECYNLRSDPDQDDYGAFQSVTKLMRGLWGPDAICKDEDVETVKQAMDDKWGNWFVGFSHFVQMPVRPTEPSLWGLLTDRAAGIMPREERDGADIFIPIFTPGRDGIARASVVLVELNGEDYTFDNPPYLPPFVNQLAGDVIRIQINFENVERPGRSFLTYGSAKKSCILRLEGIAEWLGEGASDPFVPADIVAQLEKLATPRWNIMEHTGSGALRKLSDLKSSKQVLWF